MPENTTRLNKFISDSGYSSRREADKLIQDGRVSINGRIAEMGTRISPNDTVEVNGQLIQAQKKKDIIYIAYNKPAGITCTTEAQVRGNIVDAINFPTKIFPIGRLDKFSTGLIFLTNDGDIVNKILRAGNAHEKEYLVSIDRPVTSDFIRKMSRGVPILETVTQKCLVTKEGNNTFRITLTQGLNRQIRRMCEYLGYNVTGLQRQRIMNVSLGKLKSGSWRHLKPVEMEEVNKLVANSSNTQEASVRGPKQKRKSDYRPKRQDPRKQTRRGQDKKKNERQKPTSKRSTSGRGRSRPK